MMLLMPLRERELFLLIERYFDDTSPMMSIFHAFIALITPPLLAA